jgi:hypothetical protein
MPDTNYAIVADAAIEVGPRRKVRGILCVSVCVQVLKAAPVLHDSNAAPVNEELGVKQAEFGLAF